MRHATAFTLLLAGALVLPHAGSAQESPPATTAAPALTYDALSPGNKMIARSLYDAQGPAPSDGGTGANRWTLERIAGARAAGQGWGQVFRQMKSDGAVTANSLGQVVSEYHAAPPPPPRPLPGGPRPVIITDAAGNVSAAATTAAPRGAGKAAPSNHRGGRVHAEAGGATAITSGGNAGIATGPGAAPRGASGGDRGRALGRGR